ncbi:hypothetical protein PMALA_022830 [Plasmodium malariae]|uniref:Uncharacterized protein n=1 Tax=Plasmodium malariae TaxID=5858 RepID=A0A1A8WBB4_PLAMA|nr:hypothetical protein PMALA_022830 [Plasmodium malariae]
MFHFWKMNSEIIPNYHFSVKNVNFFKNALALLNVDDNKYNINLKKGTNSAPEGESCILFNLYYDGLMLRSLSKCKQIYCFLYMDSNCFTSYNVLEKEDKNMVKQYKHGNRNNSVDITNDRHRNYYGGGPDENKSRPSKKLKRRNEDETESVNSDNLLTTHIFDNKNENVIKLKSISPLKINYTEYDENENEYSIRKRIYEDIDEKKNGFEFLVSPYDLLRALEFLDAVILNIKFDYLNRKLILHLTDEEGDTSETYIRIIVDYYYEIFKLEKYTFLNNDYNYFSLQSSVFSFYLEYLIKSNDQYITFYIREYTNDSTTVLKMETKNKNYQRSVQLMPKENFEEFKSLKNQIFKYRIKDLSKINQALSKAHMEI